MVPVGYDACPPYPPWCLHHLLTPSTPCPSPSLLPCSGSRGICYAQLCPLDAPAVATAWTGVVASSVKVHHDWAGCCQRASFSLSPPCITGHITCVATKHKTTEDFLFERGTFLWQIHHFCSATNSVNISMVTFIALQSTTNIMCVQSLNESFKKMFVCVGGGGLNFLLQSINARFFFYLLSFFFNVDKFHHFAFYFCLSLDRSLSQPQPMKINAEKN